ELGEVTPGEAVSKVGAGYIGHPVIEGSRAAIAVGTAALEEIDQELVNGVDVHAGFDLVFAFGPGNGVAELQAVLVGKRGPRQSDAQTILRHIRNSDLRSAAIGSGNFVVHAP